MVFAAVPEWKSVTAIRSSPAPPAGHTLQLLRPLRTIETTCPALLETHLGIYTDKHKPIHTFYLEAVGVPHNDWAYCWPTELQSKIRI